VTAPEQQDGMAVIERCWVLRRPNDDGSDPVPIVVFHEPEASASRFEVTEMVPASEFRGAVGALRDAAGALDFAATRIVNAEDNRHVRAMAVKARDAARGQS
jgi:hypothetical protein